MTVETQKYIDKNTRMECVLVSKISVPDALGGTTIKGFDGLEHPSVYREGMALKFFGDLVCDYLGEERIVRVY